MLARIAKRFLVLALVLVTGWHWAFLQSIAWVGMAVNYSQHSTWTEALAMTFDGRHPCKLCKAVQEGKKSEKKEAAPQPTTKLDLFCLSAALAVRPPAFPPVSANCVEPTSPLGDAPPKPPPRLG